jgi:hypothetical protein
MPQRNSLKSSVERLTWHQTGAAVLLRNAVPENYGSTLEDSEKAPVESRNFISFTECYHVWVAKHGGGLANQPSSQARNSQHQSAFRVQDHRIYINLQCWSSLINFVYCYLQVCDVDPKDPGTAGVKRFRNLLTWNSKWSWRLYNKWCRMVV